MNSRTRALVPVEHIVPSIFTIRGQLVLLESDLAALYGVTTKHLNEQVQRNLARFPRGFVFQLSTEEVGALAAQFVPVNIRDDGLPNAFTEHGAIVAAMILNSPQAVEMCAQAAGAFVQLRDQVCEVLTSSNELASRVAQLERRIESHDSIVGILEMVRELMKSPDAVHLTEAQRVELGRRLNEYVRNLTAGSP